MSHTIEGKANNIRFHVPAICAALERMGYEQGVDFHTSQACDHHIVDYHGSRRMNEPPVQVWIDRKRVKRANNPKKRAPASNEIGFRADTDGKLIIVNNQYDSNATFTPAVVNEFKQFVRVEGAKIEARRRGHQNIQEVRVGNKIHVYAQ